MIFTKYSTFYKYVVCIFLLLFSGFAIAQQESVLKLETLAIDTIVQGTDFVVTYHIVSTESKDWSVEDCGAFEFKSNYFSNKDLNINGRHYYDTSNFVTFRNYGTGEYILPKCTVNVGGETYTFEQKAIYVKPNKEYSTEYTQLREHLLNLEDINIDTCKLHATKYKNFTIFNDFEHNISAAVTKRLENTSVSPILYWSTESCWDVTKSKGFQIEMLEYYNAIIEGYNKENFVIDNGCKSYCCKKDFVAPLLKDIRYGQDEPYNCLSPKIHNKKTVIGCVSTALAQILAYSKHLERGAGQISYKTTFNNQEYILNMDFTEAEINWEKDFLPDYTTTTDTNKIFSISKLMTALAGSVCADFEEKSTAAAINNVKMSLINFWGYSPSMRLCQSLNADTICGLIIKDLDQERISLVSTKDHSFLCDGHKNGFFHFNLGWKGYCNGYYQALFTNNSSMPFPIESVIVGIEPDKGTEFKKSIIVKKANTLSSLLSDEEISNVTSLTIKGKLGCNDIAIIRRMAGAPIDDCFAPSGKLRYLDLSGVSFQTDSKGYYYKRTLSGYAGTATTTSTTTQGNRVVSYSRDVQSFNYDTMTTTEWKKFKQLGMHKRPGARVEYEDGTFCIYYFTKSKIISPSMFIDCENLTNIVLPDNITAFKDNCFNRCVSLKELYIPDSVEELDDYSLDNTTLLEKIELDQKLRNSIRRVTQQTNPNVKLHFRKRAGMNL